MCSICGVVDLKNEVDSYEIVSKMNEKMRHRGPDDSDIFTDTHACLGHNRLSVIDPERGHQPLSVKYGNKIYTIVYNGEIYNAHELRQEIEGLGIKFETNCDTEVVLYSYILFGDECPCRLNGIFAFVVYDGERAFGARDRFGVKPFYYALKNGELIFASEIKAMLSHPKIRPYVDEKGLWEILYLSPSYSASKSVFKDISELDSGECFSFDSRGLRKKKYWKIEASPFCKDREYAIEKTNFLVSDAIKRQLVSDVSLCSLLSGGLDSSVVCAIASEEYKKQGKTLDTYSFEYEGNKSAFKGSIFQPQCDDDFAIYASDYLGTNHTVLTAPTSEVASLLLDAMRCRDLPGQADIDSSLLYFCKEIKKRHTVGLSGECSDEIFGGYPWFYRPEMLTSDFLPWIHAPRLRASLFKSGVARSECGFDYARGIYRDTLRECPTLKSDTESMKVSRIASYLSVKLFMSSLLSRKDRMSMACGLEVRVPFADHRIFEHVFNVPWEIKFENGVEKALLRNAMKGKLPEEILWRKKSPYPKTHNPKYLESVLALLNQRLEAGGFLSEMLDRDALYDTIGSGKTWYGQLMGDAQLIAWLIQLDAWVEEYGVIFV